MKRIREPHKQREKLSGLTDRGLEGIMRAIIFAPADKKGDKMMDFFVESDIIDVLGRLRMINAGIELSKASEAGMLIRIRRLEAFADGKE